MALSKRGSVSSFITAIGLEVHVELKTKSKIFCRCPVAGENAKPNEASCPVCQGQPGILPALNPDVVRLGIRCALALGCDIPPRSTFERKHYVYPDLPKNYQITQNDEPLGRNGRLRFNRADGQKVDIRIRRVHMEEDAAKLEHRAIERRNVSLVDFNRCGVPLLEIVSEADVASPEDAGSYLRELHHVIRWYDISDAEMNKGQMRCDANLSVRPADMSLEDAVKWEIKNVNSFDAVVASLRRAREKQREILSRKGQSPQKALEQTTFHWDSYKREIQRRREKETANEYFYFAEPDLMEVSVTSADQEAARKVIRTDPDEARRELEELQLPPDCVDGITRDRTVYEYWRDARGAYPEGGAVLAHLITNNLQACANEDSLTLENYIEAFPADRLAELTKRLDAGEIIRNSELNKLINSLRERPKLEIMDAAQSMGLKVVPMAESEQEKQLRVLLDTYPQQMEDCRNGRKELLSFFVGKARRLLPGVKPADLHRALSRLLS
jgi:aspartyl-tRNA(Asn)/glutamyl-tRNA(Gln) amidotransferase subunit B